MRLGGEHKKTQQKKLKGMNKQGFSTGIIGGRFNMETEGFKQGWGKRVGCGGPQETK